MLIYAKNPMNINLFSQLNAGDVFWYNNELYIKTKMYSFGVNLRTGEQKDFFEATVIFATVKVVDYYE